MAQKSEEHAEAAITMANAAALTAKIDDVAASRLLEGAIRRTDALPNTAGVYGRAYALQQVAAVAKDFRRERAVALLHAAIGLAQEGHPVAQDLISGPDLTELLSQLAEVDARAARREAEKVPQLESRALILGKVATVLAKSQPDEAETVLERVSELLEKGGMADEAMEIRSRVVASIAATDPETGTILLRTVTGTANRAKVMLALVGVYAERNPRRAAEWAQRIEDPLTSSEALRTLASAEPQEASRHLQAAMDSLRRALGQTDALSQLQIAREVGLLVVTQRSTGRSEDARSLIDQLAREARVKCRDSWALARVLTLLSAVASQVRANLGEDLLREALASVDQRAQARAGFYLSTVAPDLGVLDPKLGDLIVQRAENSRRVPILLSMAVRAAGNHPDVARAWLRRAKRAQGRLARGSGYQDREPVGATGTLSGFEFAQLLRAEAEALLMSRPSDALDTVASITDEEWRMRAYVDIATRFLAWPPPQVTPGEAISRLADVLSQL